MSRGNFIARCILLVGLLVSTSIAAYAPRIDWEDCQGDLEQTKQVADDASDAAEDVHSKLEDFDECRENPDVYDLLQDGCKSKKDDYESALDDFRDKMDDLDTQVQSIQSSCGYEFTVNRMSASEAAQERLCSSYRKFLMLGMTPATVLQQCKQHMNEPWCQSCLGIR